MMFVGEAKWISGVDEGLRSWWFVAVVMHERRRCGALPKGGVYLIVQCIVLVLVEWGVGSKHRQAWVMSHT